VGEATKEEDAVPREKKYAQRAGKEEDLGGTACYDVKRARNQRDVGKKRRIQLIIWAGKST